MSPDPVSYETIRRLSSSGCSVDEIAAYSGHAPEHIAAWLAEAWWRPLGWDA